MPILPHNVDKVRKKRASSTPHMTVNELVGAGEAVFGPRWMRPLARVIGWNHRSIRYWKNGERAIPEAAAERIRNLHRIGPVGVIIRQAVRKVAPQVDPWSAHRVAMVAVAELAKAGAVRAGQFPRPAAARHPRAEVLSTPIDFHLGRPDA